MIIKVFHWAESHVDRDSPVHMLYFFLATLPFNTGIPIPLVHQVGGQLPSASSSTGKLS